MATPFTFKNAESAANQMLKADKAKLQWAKMPFTDLPRDGQALAMAAVEAEINARSAKASLQAWLDDKVEAPSWQAPCRHPRPRRWPCH